MKQILGANKAWMVQREQLISELARTLDVRASEIYKITSKLTLPAILELQTMIGKRIVAERNRSKENAS